MSEKTNLSFLEKENACIKHFINLGPVFHCCSQENFETIVTDEEYFVDLMLIIAVCSRLSPSVKIITFQIMHNHFHFILAGDKADVESFLSLLKQRLCRYIESKDAYVSISDISFKIYHIDDLEYLRSAIAYCNRNGFIVNDNVTPYSYPWGANICYFNDVGKRYYEQCKSPAKVVDLRSVFRGKTSDNAKGLFMLDGCVSPFSFCDFSIGEKSFRDAKHYFYSVSKNVESSQQIAKIINEKVAYTDDDIFNIMRKLSKEKFGEVHIAHLPPNSKVELAKILHYEYNAGKKQIQRVLKLNSAVIDSLF